MTSQTTTHVRHPGSARPRWHRLGARAAALSLALTAGAASGLAATPAWAAGGYHITATIHVGQHPHEVAVSPDGSRAYVTNASSNTVSVLNTATNRVTATIHVGNGPYGVAVSPDGTRAYVTRLQNDSVAVINTATDQVTATIGVGSFPIGVAVSPDGTRAYVTTGASLGSLSVIDTGTCHRHHPRPQ